MKEELYLASESLIKLWNLIAVLKPLLLHLKEKNIKPSLDKYIYCNNNSNIEKDTEKEDEDTENVPF